MIQRRMHRVAVAAVAGILVILGGGPAAAATLDFYCISGNNVTSCADGEAQVLMDVVDIGGGEVEFLFYNTGPESSSITDVYFDDGALLGISNINNMVGVSFSAPAIPSNLPSANNASPPFVTTAGFSADADPPPAWSGVNPGEEVGIEFALLPGMVYADVLADLADGSLRVGLRVQGFAGGYSESFVNNVPEPGSGVLLALGLIGLARRKS